MGNRRKDAWYNSVETQGIASPQIILMVLIMSLLVLLGSSCKPGTGVSISKRHYRSGFYVNNAVRENHRMRLKSIPSIPIRVPVFDVEEDKLLVASRSDSSLLSATIRKRSDPYVSHYCRDLCKALGQNYTEPSPATVSDDFFPDVGWISVKINPKKQNSVTSNLSHTYPTRDHYSLFWTVILILVIIWLIGLLAGGWGISVILNLLLVVALVLFVLWLLRII